MKNICRMKKLAAVLLAVLAVAALTAAPAFAADAALCAAKGDWMPTGHSIIISLVITFVVFMALMASHKKNDPKFNPTISGNSFKYKTNSRKEHYLGTHTSVRRISNR